MDGTEDVITGISPLEERLVGVHPRLFLTRERVDELRGRLDEEPLRLTVERVRRLAEAGDVPHASLMYLLTGEGRYLESAREAMLRILHETKWPEDVRREGVAFRDQLLNLALGYDWLHHDLDEATLREVRWRLDENGRKNFHVLAKHETYQADAYTCNSLAACMTQVAAAGLAIYGEVPDVGPWLRFVMEKVRVMTDALGPDGASQEGICYGGFYTDYYIRTLELVRELLGWDFFRGNQYLRNVPYFYIYSMLPLRHIEPRSVHLCFGDGVRYNWHGPDHFLRKLAAVYRDPHAQWAAEVQEKTGVTRDEGAFLALLWHDTSVPAQPPEELPTFRHFADKDVVFMRSGWDGDEAVFAFKCGPHSGHHALRNQYYSIGGGHMHPDAGSFQLFAHGDWLITETGYAQKFTPYANTVLVNGVGQTGDTGGRLDWFECLELRRQGRGASIAFARAGEDYDYVIGNPAAAYEPEAGLRRFLRHVLYVRPCCWVVADELSTAGPSTFELFFHSCGEPFQADRPFTPAGPNAWRAGGSAGALRITALLPGDVAGAAEKQQVHGIGPHHDREICILRLWNREKAEAAVFLNVLEAHPAGAEPRVVPSVEPCEDGYVLTLAEGERTRRFVFRPWRQTVSVPAFEPLQ